MTAYDRTGQNQNVEKQLDCKRHPSGSSTLQRFLETMSVWRVYDDSYQVRYS